MIGGIEVSEVKVGRADIENALDALERGKQAYEDAVNKIQGIVDDVTSGKVGGDVGTHVKEACETHVKSLNAGKATYDEGIETFKKALVGFDDSTESLGKEILNAQAN